MTFEPRAAWIARIKSRRADRASPPGSADWGVAGILGVLIGSAVFCNTVRTPANRLAIGGAPIHFPAGAGTHPGCFKALLAVSRVGETYRELVRKGRVSPMCEGLPRYTSRAEAQGKQPALFQKGIVEVPTLVRNVDSRCRPVDALRRARFRTAPGSSRRAVRYVLVSDRCRRPSA